MNEGYPQFGKFLNETKRPMVYSCSWPAYMQEEVINHTLLHTNFITDPYSHPPGGLQGDCKALQLVEELW